MKRITLYLREICYVPVTVEAETVEDAQGMVMEGDGIYGRRKPSELSAGDFFDNLFEQPAYVREIRQKNRESESAVT